MKKILFLYLFTFICSVLNSQPLKGRKWTAVKLPLDSLRPNSLCAFDSMNIVFEASQNTTVYNDTVFPYYTIKITPVSFVSSDGGETWSQRVNPITTLDEKAVYNASAIFLEGNSWFSNNEFGKGKYRYSFIGNDAVGKFIYRSSDYGATWNKEYNNLPLDVDCGLANVISPNALLVYAPAQRAFYSSFNSGRSFSERLMDTSLRNALFPTDTLPQHIKDSLGSEIDGYNGQIHFLIKDALHYTIQPIITLGNTLIERFYPNGLMTLLTTNGGATWKKYVNSIPNFPTLKSLPGRLQYDYNKSTLFLFPSLKGEGRREVTSTLYYTAGLTSQYNLPGEGSNGFGYIYSTNDGRTWNFDTTFGYQRRAYEPVGTGEIWLATTPDDMGIANQPYKTAWLLRRTTDYGKTWETDSSTLGSLFEQKADGHIITFSDPRHGWIVARIGANTYILRYDANEQPLAVEADKPPTYFHFMWLYPIPAKDDVQINFLKKGTIEDVEFFDVMGRKVSVPFTMNDNTATANVKDLPSGYYMVRAKLSGKYYARPLIVGK